VHWCITARRDATSDGDGAQIRAPISIGEVTMALDARPGAAPSAVVAPFVTVDHAGIARLVHAVAALWALAAAVLGVLLGLERFDAGTALVDAGAHVQLVALARVALVFGLLGGMLTSAALAAVPGQVGAAALAFPRGASLGAWLWVGGSVLVAWSIVANGGPGGGDAAMVELYLMGLGVMTLGLLAVMVVLAATVLAGRAPGRALADAPGLAWASLVAATSLVVTLATMLGSLVYVGVDFAYERSAFGGADGIGAWLGWATSQPHTFLFALPCLGVLVDAVDRATGGAVVGRTVAQVGTGIAGLAMLEPVTQSTFLLRPEGAGRDVIAGVVPWLIFSGLPLLGCLAVIGVALRSMQAARARPTGAFVAAFLAVGMVLTGLLGSAVQRIDLLGLGGTVFEEGALLYVAYGAVLASVAMRALLLGDDAAPRTLRLAGIGFLAIVLAALPLYVAGVLDQPGGALGGFDDDGIVGVLNLVSGAGHALFVLFLLGVGAAWGGRMAKAAGA
jgi:hypothetical protein